ncbi:hypothetical protein JN01_0236 [Entomoplasma freundtii]|uniref:Uncharacterized protein n=1 Tax=Entomoplasma freundtii TaxID=74700 RepID=A0A2K8NV92_9MOLU|nr:hypothetical protein [Entomoplasma freundtii]ATZ16553.1 hypothetical protein EFREU_v1c05320 [Entomoplasma freundtii]TDY58281.1 hypothetical protein JN01_0236 [Entomoplasma freundtii]
MQNKFEINDKTIPKGLTKMAPNELKEVDGGSLSGVLLGGLASLIDASTNFITSMAGIGFAFSGAGPEQAIKGDFKFNKNMSFSWDNTKVFDHWAHDSQVVKL